MFPSRRARFPCERTDAQRFLYRRHDARFGWIYISSKHLGEAVAINPEEAVVVRPYLCGTSGSRPLFAETFEALPFVQPECSDVDQSLNVGCIVRRPRDH